VDISAVGDDFLCLYDQKINFDVVPIINISGASGVFYLSLTPFCDCVSQVTIHILEPAGKGMVRRSCNLQPMVFTTEWQHEFRRGLILLKTHFKHRSL
jgi:hypothetical protein